uniref:Retinol dehydrogenase 10 n=1 Tax=Acanthochromis polyacanthus TaxID=80966 RepID=A0A3Q1GGM2_9TELE
EVWTWFSMLCALFGSGTQQSEIMVAVIQTILRPRLKCIDGELCLITGAGGALGRLFALEFAKEGAHLVLWDCNAAANEQTAKQARELGVQVHTYTVDLSKRQSIYEAADRVRAEVGCVSILVNNAGVVAGRRLLDCPDELLERTLLVNCHALFWVRRVSFTHTTHEASLYRHEAPTWIM